MSENRAVFGSDTNVPHRLRERADQLLEAGRVDSADSLLDAAVRAAKAAMNAGSGDRDAALEILVADALVTHAMDLMAGQPETFEAGCNAAIQRLAAIVDGQ